MLSVFKKSFLLRSLPPTMHQAVISLILQKDKNPLECSSYWPISLLNAGFKVLAKVLVCLLEHILLSVMSIYLKEVFTRHTSGSVFIKCGNKHLTGWSRALICF